MIYFNCYQCDKPDYLFADSRCADCTRVDPETGYVPKEPHDDSPKQGS